MLVLEHNVPGGHAVQLSSSPPSQVHSTREPFPTRLSRHVWNTMSPSSMSQLIRNVTTAWASIVVALPVHSLNATSAKEHVAVDCSNKVLRRLCGSKVALGAHHVAESELGLERRRVEVGRAVVVCEVQEPADWFAPAGVLPYGAVHANVRGTIVGMCRVHNSRETSARAR